MNKITILAAFMYFLFFSNCNNPKCSAPNPFTLYFFYYTQDGEISLLKDRSIYDKLEISYINKTGEKKYINDYTVWMGFEGEEKEGFLSTRELTAVAGSGIKEFYFEYENIIDTLYIDIDGQPHPECEGSVYTLKSILFNGDPVTSRDNDVGDLTYELFSNKL